ncbi:MAG: 50S ribosomal protein L10 [Sphaerochaetaceae bacterium]
MAKYEAKKAQYKVDAVKEIKDEFSSYNGFFFTDYRGMTVEQITTLRNQLRAKEAAYRVVKNRFAKLAMEDLSYSGPDENLIGPTAIALTKGEDASNAAAKVLFEMAKNAPLKVKGAYLDGKLFDANEVAAYSKLPTRLELIASLMGTINAPLAKLARTLQAFVDSKEN